MVSHYNPLKVIEYGKEIRNLSGGEGPVPIRKGEVRVMILDTGLDAIAPDVSKDEDFLHWDGEYGAGIFLMRRVYAVPQADIIKCIAVEQTSSEDLSNLLKQPQHKRLKPDSLR